MGSVTNFEKALSGLVPSEEEEHDVPWPACLDHQTMVPWPLKELLQVRSRRLTTKLYATCVRSQCKGRGETATDIVKM